MTTPPEGDVEGPVEPIPGGQPEGEPQPWMPMPGTYGSRNAGRRQSILEAFQKIANIDDVNGAVDGVRDDVQNMGTVVRDYGDALENKAEKWAIPTIAPLSQAINRRADPAFQLSDMLGPIVSGTFNAGTWGTFTVESSPVRMQRGANTKGNIYLTFITPLINREYSQLNFMVSEVADPCRMDVAIYIVNDDRTMHRQTLVENVTIGLGEEVATVTFGKWVATQGSYLAVAWLQHGTGNTRFILGMEEAQRPLLNTIFPRKISALGASGMQSLPATIDGTLSSQVNFTGYWFTPYAELSEDVGIDYRALSDSWPDVGEAPRPWVRLTSRGINSAGGYTAAFGVGLRVSMYDTPLSTDYVRVRSSIYSVGAGTGSNARRSTLIVRGTNNLRSGIGLSAITNTRYELIQWSNLDVESDGEWNDRTVVATINRVPTEGDQLEVDYLDGLVTVRINDQTVVDSLPVTGPVGAAGRFVGIQNRRQAFITAVWSPWFGPWSARDLPQDSGDDDEGEG